MPVRALRSAAIKVVEQCELPRQRMCVGRDVLREDAQTCVTVAFLHVSKHLVVGLVLLDDIEHMLEHQALAMAFRYWLGSRIRARRLHSGQAESEAVVSVHLSGVCGQLLIVGSIDDRDRTK